MRVEARIADAGSFKRVLQRKMSEQTKRKLNDTGRAMVRAADRKMAAQFNLNRPGDRRRYPGSRRARGALDYQIVGSELPMALRYRVLGGDIVVGRIIMMNWGSPAHRINPSGAWGGNGRILAWNDDEGWVQAGSVYHPGQRGTGFLEEAMAEAIQQVLVR